MTNTDPIFYSNWEHPEVVAELIRLNKLLVDVAKNVDNSIAMLKSVRDA